MSPKTEALHVSTGALDFGSTSQRVGRRCTGDRGEAAEKKRDVEPEHSARELGMSLVFMQLRYREV